MSAFLRQRWPETLIALLAATYALWLAEAVMAPLVLAFITAMVLTPVQDALCRLHLRPSVAATLTLVFALMVIGAIIMGMRPWIAEVIDAWPRVSAELRSAMVDMRLSLSALFDLQREVMEAIDPEAAASGSGEGSGLPSLADAAWIAPQLGAQLLIFLGGLFFFLLGKEQAYEWARVAGLRPDDFRRAEDRVAAYFGTIAMINAGLGIAVALALSAYGLPGAPVWGIIAGLANFVIYLGPAATAAALVLAGTVAFDGVAVAGPALIYLTINLMEAQFVTPMLIGQRMQLNPLLVFLSLTIWLWLWGPVGGIVAIPLVLWTQSLWADSQAHANSKALVLTDTPNR